MAFPRASTRSLLRAQSGFAAAFMTFAAVASLMGACSSFGSAAPADGGSAPVDDAGKDDARAPIEDAAVQPDGARIDASVPVDAGARLHVFVTSGTIFGRDLSREPGSTTDRNPIRTATEMCANEALKASLTGTYVAWISSSSSDARTRLLGQGPWYDSKAAQLVFATRPDSADAMALSAILLPNGQQATGYAWTGGVDTNSNCADWTNGLAQARMGDPNGRTTWESTTTGVCGTTKAAIYCFEQPAPEIAPAGSGQ